MHDTQFSKSYKGWQKVQPFHKLEYNSTLVRFQKNANRARAFMGNFHCVVQRVSVLWRSICIALFTTWKRISKMSTLPPLEKYLRTPMATDSLMILFTWYVAYRYQQSLPSALPVKMFVVSVVNSHLRQNIYYCPLEVKLWRCEAMLLLHNKDQQQINPLASYATCLCRQRSGNVWSAIASSSLHLHGTRTVKLAPVQCECHIGKG